MTILDAPSSLSQWDLDVDELPELRRRISSRPDYPLAARRLAANTLRDAEGDARLAGLLKDAGRTVAGLSAAYLDASGAVTLPRLKDFMVRFGLVSPGRARALLNYMRYLGYVRLDAAAPDARAATYHLTPEFLASYTRHQAGLLEAVEVIAPDAGLIRRCLGDRRVLDTLVVEQANAFAKGSPQAQDHGRWYAVFMHRLAGIQILHALVAASDEFPPSGLIPFSFAATARRFQVSRMHVARMIGAAEHEGFLEQQPQGVVFTSAGRAALDWLYANRLCVHLACAARTLRAHPELRERAEMLRPG